MTATPLTAAPDALLKAKKTPDLVEIPVRTILSIDGAGDPNDPAFADAIGALYGIAYGIRFSRKAAGRSVFKVGPLVGEWRAEGVDIAAGEIPARDAWRWTLQMDVPEDVSEDDLARMVETATTKRGGKLEGSETPRRIWLMRTEPARYGRILHVGSYADEPETFARLDEFLEGEGLRRERWHVEVYLSDPGRTAPEKLRTALLAKVV